MADLLGERYRGLYQHYYDDGSVTAKRGMSAADALDHIHAIAGGDSFNRVVDVGAGEGSLLQILDDSKFARELYGLEISPSGLQAIRARNLKSLVEAKPFDGYEIPYEDKFFDLAILCHVLEHVEHERILLRELRRIARRIVIEVPLEHGFRIDRKIAISSRFGHINYYLPETVLNLLATSGLRVIRSEICCSSLTYEQHVAGRARGLIMSRLRRAALRVTPRMAPWIFTYLFAAYCEPDEERGRDGTDPHRLIGSSGADQ
jgi:SAM-dependent methyltransferase